MVQPSSLLHWVRGMLDIRRQHPVLGSGAFEILPTDNEAVLAYIRYDDDETILCVMNMANTPRAATITLPARYRRWHVTDVFGGAGFPAIDEDGQFLSTLGSRDFFWLTVSSPDRVVQAPVDGMPASVEPKQDRPAPSAVNSPTHTTKD